MGQIPVLLITSNVEGGARLDHAGLFRAARQAHRGGALSEGFRLEQAMDAHLEDLGEEVRRHKPQVIVLSCHGQKGGRPVLKDAEGLPRDQDPEVVAAKLTAGVTPARLVVLNVCHSLPLAKALLARGVRCVIGAETRIPADTAQAFVARLLAALFDGLDVRAAFEGARVSDGTDGPRDGGGLYCEEAPDTSAAAMRFRPRLAPERRRVIVLDVYDTEIDVDDALSQLEPARRAPELLRASDHLGFHIPRSGWDPEALSWPRVANAVHALMDQALDGLEDDTQLVVLGHAPLSAFAHVGQRISRWSRRAVVVNRRHDGTWDVIDLRGAPDEGARFFRAPTGLAETSQADGVVAVYVSVMAQDAAPHSVTEMVRARLGPLAGLVCLLTGEARALHEDNAEVCARELQALASRVRVTYPRSSGVALFVAGPATLAYIAGRAFNPNQQPMQLSEFNRGPYVPTWSLPWKPTLAPAPIPADAEAQLKRRAVLDGLLGAVDQLREKLAADQLRLPPSVQASVPDPEALRALLIDKLRDLDVDRGEGGEAFELSVPERRLSFGAGLLQALVGAPDASLKPLGALFLLHELYHFEQGVSSVNYRGVGRAGLVLEEVDYHADVFAALTYTQWQIARRGEDGREACRAILERNIEAMLSAFEAFDRMEQGEAMAVLPERRLRRYLIWTLQLARARTVRDPEDIDALFSGRLFVELAPLRGGLSEQHDKLVVGATEDTQLFVSLGGRVLRWARQPSNFEPAALVDAVRRMDRPALLLAMRHVVDAHQETLTPWVKGTRARRERR